MLFPGMDPYLEDPKLWPGVHATLVVYLRDQLQPRLGPRYIATVEERVLVAEHDRHIVPDLVIQRPPALTVARYDQTEATAALAVEDEVDEPLTVRMTALDLRQRYIEILDRQSGQRVVTVIEVVSPWNKHAGPGRELYVAKQREVLESATHLIEIDLLRAGSHVVGVAEWLASGVKPYDYLVCANRAVGLRDAFEVYPRTVRERLPRLRVPLADGDADTRLDLQSAIARVYESGRYADRIDYSASCVPPLREEDRAWAAEIVRQARESGRGAQE